MLMSCLFCWACSDAPPSTEHSMTQKALCFLPVVPNSEVQSRVQTPLWHVLWHLIRCCGK